MKLGLLPHVAQVTDLKATDYYSPQSSLPDSFGATGLNWQMFGNDQYGDCYFASAAHEVMAEAHLAGRSPQFATSSVLRSYAQYLGLPGASALNEANDQGTDARGGARFRRQIGVLDENGRGHKIGAYAFIEEPDYALLKSAVYDFGAVTVCVNLPRSAEETFETGVWDYVSGSPILGGHAVAGTSVRDGELVIVSWGQEVVMTEAFVDQYLQAVVVYVSGSALNGEGKTVNGLDRDALRAALGQIAHG